MHATNCYWMLLDASECKLVLVSLRVLVSLPLRSPMLLVASHIPYASPLTSTRPAPPDRRPQIGNNAVLAIFVVGGAVAGGGVWVAGGGVWVAGGVGVWGAQQDSNVVIVWSLCHH